MGSSWAVTRKARQSLSLLLRSEQRQEARSCGWAIAVAMNVLQGLDERPTITDRLGSAPAIEINQRSADGREDCVRACESAIENGSESESRSSSINVSWRRSRVRAGLSRERMGGGGLPPPRVEKFVCCTLSANFPEITAGIILP